VPFHARACEVFLDGDFEGYERMIGEALEIARRAGSSDAVAVFGGQMTMLRREQDRLDEMRPTFENVLARHPDVPAYRINLAWVHGEAGRLDEARSLLEPIARAGVDAIRSDGFALLNLYYLGETAARLDDRELAAAVYDRLLPYSGRAVVLGAVLCFGAADRTLGLLAATLERGDAAAAHFEQALRLDAAMEAVPCLAHSRVEAARFLIGSGEPKDAARARDLLAEVHASAEAHGLALAQRRAREVESALPGAGLATEPEPQGNLLQREGETWRVRFEGSEMRLRHSKGVECLAALLAEPGREWSALDLAGGGREPAAAGASDVVIDQRARVEYREQLDALREQLEEAERFRDAGRLELLQREIEFLSAELAAGLGLGGSARRVSGPSERARKAVYNRVRNALGRIREAHPELARHLEASVRTGHRCSYQPERPTPWHVEGL